MTQDYNRHDEGNLLKILQYNKAKRREIMDSIFNDRETQDHAILLLQEPCRTYKQTMPLLHQSWMAFEPTHPAETQPRTTIYINNKKIPPATVEQIPIPHSDVTAIALPALPPLQKPTLIVNLYNSNSHTLIDLLPSILSQNIKIEKYDIILIAGDFNLHYALWNPMGYTDQEPQAQILVDIMMDANLTPLLPSGTVTFPPRNETEHGTTIDLVWGNETATDTLLKCHTVEQTNDHGSDY